MSPSNPSAPQRGSMRYTCTLFAVIVTGTALGGMTQTALNTMATAVLADLHTDIGWGQWLATIYIFCMGAAVPLASFVQRRFSVRALMLISFGLFLVGSLCDFAAINFAMLIVGRVLEALASGILMPLLQTIAMTRFPENRHGTAMGVAGIALGFAPNIGPTLGGAIASMVGWRYLFLLLAGCSALFVIATLAIVSERDAKDPAATLDAASLALSTFGFGGLLLGFTAAANVSPAHPLVWASTAVGIVCVVLFIMRQRRIANPLINLRIFAHAPYRVSMATQCLLYGCFMGMTLLIPLTVVEAGGHSTLEAGLVLLPGAVAALIFEPGAGAASDRFGPRRVSIFGGVFLALGAISIAFVPADAPLWVPACCQAARCIGLTTLIPTTTAAGLGPLGREGITTDGSAGLIMSRQIAAALATAVMVFLLKLFNTAATPALGYHVALGFSGLLGALCLLMAALFIRDSNPQER
ncbi:MAG: MFS transporter [Coriobacteriales bacterium]